MAAQPGTKPSWADSGTKTEPSPTKKNNGWSYLERVPHEWWNWLLNNLCTWVKWFADTLVYATEIGIYYLTITPTDDGSCVRVKGGEGTTNSGGDVIVAGGNGATSSNQDGGSIFITGGLKDGSGANGKVFLQSPVQFSQGSTDIERFEYSSFAATWFGVTGTPAATVYYHRLDRLVWLLIPELTEVALTGTSFGLSGLPVDLRLPGVGAIEGAYTNLLYTTKIGANPRVGHQGVLRILNSANLEIYQDYRQNLFAGTEQVWVQTQNVCYFLPSS